jgi:hypothetical protein
MSAIIAAIQALCLLAGPAQGYPPCQTEDSRHCVWNAQEQGNGRGHSFIAWPNGSTTYLN